MTKVRRSVIKINLLPWREQLREELKREFLITMGMCAGFALFLMFSGHLLMSSKIGSQEAKNKTLQQEILVLDNKIKQISELKKKKQQLLARMNIIQQLQTSRPTTVHLFDQFVTILPEGIHLSQIKRSGERISVLGKAESNTNVSTLMRNVDASLWLKSPLLSEVKTDKKDGVRSSDFELDMMQEFPHKPSDEAAT